MAATSATPTTTTRLCQSCVFCLLPVLAYLSLGARSRSPPPPAAHHVLPDPQDVVFELALDQPVRTSVLRICARPRPSIAKAEAYVALDRRIQSTAGRGPAAVSMRRAAVRAAKNTRRLAGRAIAERRRDEQRRVNEVTFDAERDGSAAAARRAAATARRETEERARVDRQRAIGKRPAKSDDRSRAAAHGVRRPRRRQRGELLLSGLPRCSSPPVEEVRVIG